MAEPQSPKLPPPPLVALAGWAVPGLGYWLIGQKSRALVVGLTILALFVLGLAIGGVRVIEAPAAYSLQGVLGKPWFIGQVLAGPITLATNHIANTWGEHGAPYSHARVYDIGTLYTAVAGMLNLMAVVDSAYRAANDGER